MSLTPGTRLGIYEVNTQIGAGGMGEVYRATDSNLKRSVAIKVLPASLAGDADRLVRFQREAEVLAALNHPNIAAIYGLEKTPGFTALVMELVEGDDLSQRIAQGPIPLDDALRIARQIADALAAAHDQGIIHRDLKPANIKVRPDGAVKVLDFGLAKAMEPTGMSSSGMSLSPTITSPAMTQAGLILGTAAYMSPEQARGKTVDKRSDIWSFGCVIFEMLTAFRAFDAEDVSLTLSRVLQREPDFAALPSSVPPHITQTLRVCLRKDPRERPGDARDVRLALDGAFQGDAPPPVAPVPAVPTSHRRAPWIAAAASLLLAAATGYGWWRATRPVERPLTRLSVDLGPDAMLAARETMAISPDGTRIVFVGRAAADPGTRQLYTRRLDESAATPIRSTVSGPSLSMPTFSPAGDWVAYVAGNVVRKVPVQGGSAFVVAEMAGTLLGISWGDDDSIVIGSTQGLHRVPSSGGAPQRLKTTEGFPKWLPAVLPGSTAILMGSADLAGLSTLDDLSVEVFNTKTNETKTLLPGGYSPHYVPTSRRNGHLLFIRQGTLLGVSFDPERLEIRGTPVPLVNDAGMSGIFTGSGQFTFSNTGMLAYLAFRQIDTAYQIAWLTPSGPTTPIVAQPSMYGAPRLSPDGSRLAYSAPGSKGSDVWVYDPQRKTPTQLTFTGVGTRELAWAPDSKHLVIGDGDSLLWIRADGSGEPQRLLEKSRTPRPANFSPDGRLVYSPFGSQGLPDVWTLPVDLRDPEHPKAGKPEAFLSQPYVEVDPAFSPDGKFIAYASTESGPNELFVRSFPGPGGKWKISTAGGKFPAWSPKTHELFFLGGDDRIMVSSYTISGDAFAASVPRQWSPTQVFRDGVRQNFDISPDGKRVVMFPRPMEGKQPEGSLHANFLLNFFDEVRRRIP